ncbi:TRAP transporter substrate-binding protein DctP [Crystallibacter crystallopoietes]|nr:TRAP transporter substrate-binding protein DctP [Arthrobacter crystallopoietes]
MLALTGCAAEADAISPAAGQKDDSIRLADSYSTSHPFARHGVSVFLEKMEAAGFDVSYFPSGQMGSAQDLAALVKSEVLDIGPASAAYLEDQFPLSSVSDLPNMTDDACVASGAMMDLLGEGGILYEAEYRPQGLRPLWISIIPGYEVMTASTQVTTPDDVDGLVMRSSGGAFDVTMEAIGATAVSMSAGDTYEAMTRGTIDGTPMPYVSVASYSLEEVTGYSTDGLNLGSVGIPYVISEETWDALSREQQASVRLASAAASQSLCDGLNEEREAARKKMSDAGVSFSRIEGSDAAAWDAILADVRVTWARSLDKINLPGTNVLSAYEEAVKRHEK